MEYKELVNSLVEELKRLYGVSKIILYGSVAKGTQRQDSDVDIAIIVEDLMGGVPMDFEGYPLMHRSCLDNLRKKHPKSHIVIYWKREYEDGISLGRDSLNNTGKVIFEHRSY